MNTLTEFSYVLVNVYFRYDLLVPFMQLNTLLYFIVYFYRDNAQLKVIAPELADT